MPFCFQCRFMALAGLIVMPPAWAASPAEPAVNAKTSIASPHPLEYKSSLHGYQSHSDPEPIPWFKANETVRQIGGWRAYVKEAEPPKVDNPAVTPTPGSKN